MNKVFGILAHVDAGKTTLSESILFNSGFLRQAGRVDFRTSFLDNGETERNRGITIFSKQAVFNYKNNQYTLIDTPGHSDFSFEVVKSLDILDFAILLISGTDGIQSHTKFLWKLLQDKHIPTIIFVNKCDVPDIDKDERLLEIYDTFSDNVPVLFGSALKNIGIKELLDYIDENTVVPTYEESFNYRFFRISTDKKGQKLNFIKITGGSLKVKDSINGEKVNEIRIYSGDKYEAVNEVKAGTVCAVLGPQNIGLDSAIQIAPINYRVLATDGTDSLSLFEKLGRIAEEQPQLNLTYNEYTHEVRVNLMGKMDREIFCTEVKRRLDIPIKVDSGKIIYKETIKDTVIGSGHFEPLRHYAEVHLKIEPIENGSGIIYDSICPSDSLASNWQRLIISGLENKRHKGVLTGSVLTDVKITLIAGKAHPKHTEGGDFRQASCRAVRQGLMKAENILLEPMMNFSIILPFESIGRSITDLTEMGCTFSSPCEKNGLSEITGTGPLRKLFDYQEKVTEYSRGKGKIEIENCGYAPCKESEKIISDFAYNPQADLRNSPDSVFCVHGSGEIIPWNEVEKHCDIDIKERPAQIEQVFTRKINIDDKTLQEIFKREFKNFDPLATRNQNKTTEYKTTLNRESTISKNYLIIDGYNFLYARKDTDRETMLNLLSSYSAFKNLKTYVIFDAYNISGNGKNEVYNNINIHYTGKAESADLYIEKLLHEIGKNNHVRVVTSDWMIQLSALSSGILRTSSHELWEEIAIAVEEMKAFING